MFGQGMVGWIFAEGERQNAVADCAEDTLGARGGVWFYYRISCRDWAGVAEGEWEEGEEVGLKVFGSEPWDHGLVVAAGKVYCVWLF